MRLAMPHNAPASLFVHGVMHRIKTYNAISSKGLDRFELERYEVGRDIANPVSYTHLTLPTKWWV